MAIKIKDMEKAADQLVVTANQGKVMAKVAQFYSGVEMMGSKQSVHSREADLEVTPLGLRIHSKKTRRIILVPFANIKGIELFPGGEG